MENQQHFLLTVSIATLQCHEHELGLGTCWVHVNERTAPDGRTSEEFFRNLVGAPNKFTVMCLIAVGYPDEEKPVYTEKNVNLDKVSYNKYGNR